MRTLKYAILGLLNRKSMTGYDISKEFDKDLNNFWHARHSQIYPELKKLTLEGLISFEVEVTGEVLEKKVYSITATGREDLTSWLCLDEDLEPTPKDVFKLRLYFSEAIDAIELKKLIKSQYNKRLAKFTFLKDALDLYTTKPAIGSPEFGDYMVLTSANIREEAYLNWLKLCLDQLEQEQA